MPGPDLDPLLDWGRALGVRGDVEEVHSRPWATTARVGRTWVKACGDGARHEAALLGGLLWWGAPHAVLPMAVDAERGYVALPDAGPLLRDVDDTPAQWPELLAEHAALQRRLQPHADEAVSLGVPDLRPERLPEALEGLLARVPVERRPDTALLAERCARLAAGPVAASVQHDDLHAGNVVVGADGARRVLDWGDATVGHPFGVLLVTLRWLPHRYGEDVDTAALRDAYLEPWTDLAPLAELRALADDAVAVQPVGRALCWERALVTADDAERAEHGDAVPGWLEVLD